MKPKKLPAGQFRNDDGTIALVVCPKCKAENYALNIPSGICTWCGYNANADHTADIGKMISNV